MSGAPTTAVGHKGDTPAGLPYVRFTPESGHRLNLSGCPLCAKSGHMQCSKNGSLFDHLVGASEDAFIAVEQFANLV